MHIVTMGARCTRDGILSHPEIGIEIGDRTTKPPSTSRRQPCLTALVTYTRVHSVFITLKRYTLQYSNPSVGTAPVSTPYTTCRLALQQQHFRGATPPPTPLALTLTLAPIQ